MQEDSKIGTYTYTKSETDHGDALKILKKEIEIYPYDFLKNSGLKLV